jgi:hypothetical protein
LAARDVPPLNPVQPIHNSPATASIRSILLGGNRSLSFGSRGPTCHHQTHPTHARPHVLDSLDQRRKIPKAIFPYKFISANLECLQKISEQKMEDDGRSFEVLRQLFGVLYFGEFSRKDRKLVNTSPQLLDSDYQTRSRIVTKRETRTHSPDIQQ